MSLGPSPKESYSIVPVIKKFVLASLLGDSIWSFGDSCKSLRVNWFFKNLAVGWLLIFIPRLWKTFPLTFLNSPAFFIAISALNLSWFSSSFFLTSSSETVLTLSLILISNMCYLLLCHRLNSFIRSCSSLALFCMGSPSSSPFLPFLFGWLLLGATFNISTSGSTPYSLNSSLYWSNINLSSFILPTVVSFWIPWLSNFYTKFSVWSLNAKYSFIMVVYLLFWLMTVLWSCWVVNRRMSLSVCLMRFSVSILNCSYWAMSSEISAIRFDSWNSPKWAAASISPWNGAPWGGLEPRIWDYWLERMEPGSTITFLWSFFKLSYSYSAIFKIFI